MACAAARPVGGQFESRRVERVESACEPMPADDRPDESIIGSLDESLDASSCERCGASIGTRRHADESSLGRASVFMLNSRLIVGPDRPRKPNALYTYVDSQGRGEMRRSPSNACKRQRSFRATFTITRFDAISRCGPIPQHSPVARPLTRRRRRNVCRALLDIAHAMRQRSDLPLDARHVARVTLTGHDVNWP